MNLCFPNLFLLCLFNVTTLAVLLQCKGIAMKFCLIFANFFLFSSLSSSHILGTILFIHQFLFFCNCSVHAGLSELNCHGDFVAIKEIAALFCSYLYGTYPSILLPMFLK